MKKLIRAALVVLIIVLAGNFAHAQTKIGYVNVQQVVSLMPEAKTVKTQLEVFSKEFTDALTQMQTELQTKSKEFQANSATMTDAVRSSKQAELSDIQNRLQSYNTTAQQKYQDKSNELIKPLADKAHAAVADVAREKGYTYILDTSQIQLLVSPDGDDVLPAVKAKLGIK